MNTYSSVTLVTCYYKITSKHANFYYEEWINILLKNLNCNIIIFTSSDLEQYFEDLRKQNTKLKMHIVIKEFHNLEIINKYNIWDDQYSKDPTPKIRTKECYMIWNSKMNFLKEAITINPFNSNKFIWNDVGSMRDYNYIIKYGIFNYPKYNNISNDKMDIVCLINFDNKTKNIKHKIINKEYFQNETHLSGSIFGGSKETLLKIIDLYYTYFQDYLDKNLFIGCDQQILATLYIRHPELFNLIKPELNTIDEWFYMYHYYSQ
jgi:hypothetical protein